jgi:hypothetical protein
MIKKRIQRERRKLKKKNNKKNLRVMNVVRKAINPQNVHKGIKPPRKFLS